MTAYVSYIAQLGLSYATFAVSNLVAPSIIPILGPCSASHMQRAAAQHAHDVHDRRQRVRDERDLQHEDGQHLPAFLQRGCRLLVFYRRHLRYRSVGHVRDEGVHRRQRLHRHGHVS